MWSFSTQRAHLGPDAHLRTLNVSLGARMARNTVHVVLAGRDSQADLLGIVNSAGRQHTDFETLQDHFGDGTRSDLVIHDALRDRSSANFTGSFASTNPRTRPRRARSRRTFCCPMAPKPTRTRSWKSSTTT